MILNADGIVMLVAVDDFGQTSGLNREPSFSSIHCLHDDHVTAVATFGEESAGSGIGFEGRNDLQPVNTEKYEKTKQSESYYLDYVAAYSDYNIITSLSS